MTRETKMDKETFNKFVRFIYLNGRDIQEKKKLTSASKIFKALWSEFEKDEENTKGNLGCNGDSKMYELPNKIRQLCQALHLLFSHTNPIKCESPKVGKISLKNNCLLDPKERPRKYDSTNGKND